MGLCVSREFSTLIQSDEYFKATNSSSCCLTTRKWISDNEYVTALDLEKSLLFGTATDGTKDTPVYTSTDLIVHTIDVTSNKCNNYSVTIYYRRLPRSFIYWSKSEQEETLKPYDKDALEGKDMVIANFKEKRAQKGLETFYDDYRKSHDANDSNQTI
jgi:hypothetical protein